MKDHCNALFFTEEKLANHEKFCHSEHPLGGAESSETLKRTSIEEIEVIENPIVGGTEQAGEPEVYEAMVKMSFAFFDDLLGKRGSFGAGVGLGAEVVERGI